MSYTTQEENGKFNILEKNTGVLIVLETENHNARDLCRKLNLGSGFNGWTPHFFTNKPNAIYEEI